MTQPFGVGDVVGGRYRITHHVVTSADQDIVFQAVDQVLNREVSVLLASTANAKQVATSARELATGDRTSEVQVLDLGLSADRTYLISTLTHPNELLDLVVPDAAPFVEPFFTDSLGQELFGQSRVMEPETYADDEEYYAELQDHLAESDGETGEEPEDAGTRFRRGRPAFLSRVSDSINRRLRTDRDADRLVAEAPDHAGAQTSEAASAAAGALAGSSGGALDDLEVVDSRAEADTDEAFTAGTATPGGPEEESPATPDAGLSTDSAAFVGDDADDGAAGDVSAAAAASSAPDAADADLDALERQARDEEVIDDPPAAPPTTPPADVQSVPAAAQVEQDRPSFTGLIRPIGRDDDARDEPAAAGFPGVAAAAGGSAGADGDAEEPEPSEDSERSGGAGRWVALAALAALVLVGAVAAFLQLRGAEAPDSQAGADSSAEETTEGSGDVSPSEQSSESAAESPSDSPSPSEPAEAEPLALSGVTREVPDSPGLNAETDGQLPNLIDDDPSSTWTTFNYGSAEFGGFASQLDLVVELEESAEVTAVTLSQQTDTEGGSFEVLVGDSASGEGATSVGTGTWNWNDTTVELEEPAEGQYVIIRTTALPLQTSPGNADLPYSLTVGEIAVEGR
ncbi:hypothetical protein [Nesterenkonia sp. F]|uniref:hypothetical protein n=1 Tax=Nesterenkonia sp. F TaxID=795955 RepID=UPI000255D3A7|nr:hypothetical protein [Nesterenkonia sp. F]